MAYKLANVSNLAAFGVEWKGETGVLHQLVNSRGTTGLYYAIKAPDSDRWGTPTRVVEPSRFGLTEPPTTYKAFLAIARAFVEA